MDKMNVPEVIDCNLNLQRRLEIMIDALTQDSERVPASRIKDAWGRYVETLVEPVGWQAVWHSQMDPLLGQTSQPLKFRIVEVEDVDCRSLTATVHLSNVCGSEEDAVEKEENCAGQSWIVPLIELYPTVEQENSALNVHITAQCLDLLRFFYVNLWFPWDEDDDAFDWPTRYLEMRMQLHYDMEEGQIPLEMVDRLRSLLKEGKSNSLRMAELEENLGSDSESDGEPSETDAMDLLQLHSRQNDIRQQFRMLENPVLRNLMIKYHTSCKQKTAHSYVSSDVSVVWPGGSLPQLQDFLNKVSVLVKKEENIRCIQSLQDAFDVALPGSLIVLPPGKHHVRGCGQFSEGGGKLIGLGLPQETIVAPADAGDVLLSFGADKVELSSLTVHGGSKTSAIVVHRGSVALSHCIVKSANSGIVVLGGGTSKMDECEVIGCDVGISVHSAAEVDVNKSSIQTCRIGVQLQEEVGAHFKDCRITECHEWGVSAEFSQNGSETKDPESGALDLLMRVPGVTAENVSFENNTEGDVLVAYQYHSFTLHPESGDSGLSVAASSPLHSPRHISIIN